MYTPDDLELPDQLPLADVVGEANRLLKKDPELVDSTEFTERTVYYYVQKRLLPRRAGRGPGTTYPPSFVYRLLFIRLLQKRGLSLDEIHEGYLRDAMNRIPDTTIKRVLLGEEPLEWGYAADFDYSDVENRREAGEEVLLLADQRPAASFPKRPPIAPASSTRESLPPFKSPAPRVASSVTRRVPQTGSRHFAADAMSGDERLPNRSEYQEKSTRDIETKSYPLGPSAELLVHRRLTPAQARRLEHIARLIRDILDEPE